MGAGCNYTLNQNHDIKAYWLDIPQSDTEDIHERHWENEFFFTDFVTVVKDNLKELKSVTETYDESEFELWYSNSFKIVLETTHQGDGLLILLECITEDYEPHYELMLSKLEQVYSKIIKHLNKIYSLNIATSGWTSGQVDCLEMYLPAGYSLSWEYNGNSFAQLVLRHCDEYVKGFETVKQAMRYAKQHDKKRISDLETA